MRAFPAATAPWVDESLEGNYEVEAIRSQLAAVWRAINASVEERLASNGTDQAVLSDLFHVGRMASLVLAAESNPDGLFLVSTQMQDLLALKDRRGGL